MPLSFLKKSSKNALQLESILGFKPRRLTLYEQALTHKSEAIKNNNERLEFLGDAVLDAIVADFIYKKYPKKDEGELTKIKSKLVNRSILTSLGIKIGLDELLKSNIKKKPKTIYGNALEAIVGAIYLDKGFATAQKFVTDRLYLPHVDIDEIVHKETDFKSRVIEWAQKKKKNFEFEVEEIERGKDKLFLVKLFIDNKIKGKAESHNKKKAEQIAAEQFFTRISSS